MPERVFNAEKFHTERRRKGLKQPAAAAFLGVSPNQVSRYERGLLQPPPEKLPAAAALVSLPLDDLAPRHGLPDLRDLRCDAGLQQRDTPKIIGTKSAVSVGAAEKGLRRLHPDFVAPLAEAYGVSVAELEAAQERSFGKSVPDVRRGAPSPAGAPGAPRTLAEKITYLLDQTYAAGSRPTDAELARKGNAKVGGILLSDDLVRRLRTGEADTDDADVLGALAAAMDAPPVFFTSDSPEEAARIVAGIRTVALGVMAARGAGERPLNDEWLDFIASSIQDIIGDQGGPPEKA
ncbi:helix-turn-helix transcriptional regulator [Streptomyces sp. MMBL 11-1]|uniref:helix-turn-helix transcriptional regulator n=1 Tax=Streptomyces sp. MMBL 11-1 TaxID=3026420 RepID=UPI00235ECFF5|nr:helix-turn-helix transcriptional regulator [Streptomyces sp. MMBL 11-1]